MKNIIFRFIIKRIIKDLYKNGQGYAYGVISYDQKTNGRGEDITITIDDHLYR